MRISERMAVADGVSMLDHIAVRAVDGGRATVEKEARHAGEAGICGAVPGSVDAAIMNDKLAHQNQERLEALLLEGLDSGEPIPASAKFWEELKREAVAQLESRAKARG